MANRTRASDRLGSDADYLSLLTRKLFHSGFNKALVDAKWPAFEAAFKGFNPATIATFGDADRTRLRANSGIVRHGQKIDATIANARHFVAQANAQGRWMDWLYTLRPLPYAEREAQLRAALTRCGPNTIFYFLLEAGEATIQDKPHGVR